MKDCVIGLRGSFIFNDFTLHIPRPICALWFCRSLSANWEMWFVARGDPVKLNIRTEIKAWSSRPKHWRETEWSCAIDPASPNSKVRTTPVEQEMFACRKYSRIREKFLAWKCSDLHYLSATFSQNNPVAKLPAPQKPWKFCCEIFLFTVLILWRARLTLS